MISKKRIISVSFISVVVIIIGVFLFYSRHNKNHIVNNSNLDSVLITATPAASNKVSYDCSKGKSVFELLKKTDPNVSYSKSNYGVFVTAINGIKQGNGRYWLFSVDGKEATVSADTYICQGNETVDWELK